MNLTHRLSGALLVAALGLSASRGFAQAAPYKILNQSQTLGNGGIDYVLADSAGRRVYVPRGGDMFVFDLDTLKLAGTITGNGGHGAAVDPKSHHGFSSSKPVSMWDAATLTAIKKIDVQGSPDGIFFEPASERVYVFSHSAPNVTVLDPKDGSIAGTIDLGGMPEQAASDGKGHLYVVIEDKNNVAVVDVKTLQVTAHYDLAGKGGTPAGLGLDAKNHILFAFCRTPATCVILSADDGKILETLPIGSGTDGGGFNPDTMEAFSSQRDGTLTIIKEKSPTSFEVEQTVQTKSGAKTCSLDSKTGHIVLITTERAPTPAGDAAAAPAATSPAGTNQAAGGGRGGRGGRGGGGGPALLDVFVVGR